MRQKTNEEYFNILNKLKQDFTENYDAYLKNSTGLNLLSVVEGVDRLMSTPLEDFGDISREWEDGKCTRYGLHEAVVGKLGEVFAQLILGRMCCYSIVEDVQDKHNQSDKKIDLLIKQQHWKQKYSVQVKAGIVGYDGKVKIYKDYFEGSADRLLLIDLERGYYIFGNREKLKFFCIDYMKEYNTSEIPTKEFERWSRIENKKITIKISEEIQQLSKKIGV